MTEIPDLQEMAGKLKQAPMIQFNLPALDAFSLVSLLQLAVRHPGLSDTMHPVQVGLGLANFIQTKLAEFDPAIAEFLQLGWDDRYDMSDSEFDQAAATGIHPRELYSSMGSGLKQEVLANCGVTRMLIEELGKYIQGNPMTLFQELSARANAEVDQLSPEEIDAAIDQLDQTRQLFQEGRTDELPIGGIAVVDGELVTTPPDSRMPDYYRPPYGLPLRWQDEQTGRLPEAVEALFEAGQSPEPLPVTPEQIELIRDYLRHYIHAPCWQPSDILDELRDRVTGLDSVAAIWNWVQDAMAIGLDPF